jgi:hypothetical protein
MSHVQLRSSFLDTNSFLTQDHDDFLLNEFIALSTASSGEGSGEASWRCLLAREEAKLEKEMVQMVGNSVVRRRRC